MRITRKGARSEPEWQVEDALKKHCPDRVVFVSSYSETLEAPNDVGDLAQGLETFDNSLTTPHRQCKPSLRSQRLKSCPGSS